VPPQKEFPCSFKNLAEFGRLGRIRFIPRDVMSTTISGSEEILRIRYLKGFCEFCLTAIYTTGLLKLILRTLIQDWPIIIDARARRDVTNVFELPTLTEWKPDQDLSQDAREIDPPPRAIEERGRGTFIKKYSTSCIIKRSFRGKPSLE
jgi:hypothetical protein